MTADRLRSALVTGGAGRLGGLVVAALRARDIRTLSLARHAQGHADDHSVDVTDIDGVLAAAEGIPIDVIVHLAAVIHGDEAAARNRQMDDSVAALVRRNGARHLVFTSTAAVYGEQADGVTEATPTTGTSAYARSKLASEHALNRLVDSVPGLSATVLRVFNIAGPRFDTSLVQRLLAATPTTPATLTNPDGFVRDYVHQADVVRAVVAASELSAEGYRVVDVAGGVPVSTRLLLSSLSIPDTVWIESDGPSSISWSASTALRRDFGIVPRSVPDPSWANSEPAR